MYDLDHYISDINLKNKERFRLSIRPKFKHQLTESLYLVAEVFYKPNVVDFCDFIVHTKINLNFVVFKQGFLRMSYEHEYNTFPATDKVKKRDALLLVGVGFKLWFALDEVVFYPPVEIVWNDYFVFFQMYVSINRPSIFETR